MFRACFSLMPNRIRNTVLHTFDRTVMIMKRLTHRSFFKSGNFEPLNSQINTFKTSFADAIKKAWILSTIVRPLSNQ